MKKLCLLFTAICLLSLNDAEAQLGKGKFMTGMASTISLGGAWGSELMSLGFLSSNDDYRETILNLMPRGGYFVTNNVLIGADVIGSLYTEKSKDGDFQWTQNLLGAGPVVRYYYPLESCYPFGEVNMFFGREVDKYKSASYEEEEIYSVLIIIVAGGVSKPIGQRATLDASLGYSRASWKHKDGIEENGKEVCQGVIVKVGFSVYFDL